MNDIIDEKTESAARLLCEGHQINANRPWQIKGGGFVPGWIFYVGEATKLIRLAEMLAKIKVK